MSYEQLERQRLEEELAQERAEGQAQRSALRVQLRRLQSELDAARVDSLPHDWPTVKQIWIEGDMHKERQRRAGLALRDAQTLVEVLQDQVHAALTDAKNMHAEVAELERQHVEQVVLRAVHCATSWHITSIRRASLLCVSVPTNGAARRAAKARGRGEKIGGGRGGVAAASAGLGAGRLAGC